MKKSKESRRPKRLTLSRETVKKLECGDLAPVAGGDASAVVTVCGLTCSGSPRCAIC